MLCERWVKNFFQTKICLKMTLSRQFLAQSTDQHEQGLVSGLCSHFINQILLWLIISSTCGRLFFFFSKKNKRNDHDGNGSTALGLLVRLEVNEDNSGRSEPWGKIISRWEKPYFAPSVAQTSTATLMRIASTTRGGAGEICEMAKHGEICFNVHAYCVRG